MLFYAVANKDIEENYYDFEINTWGDGLCGNNLLPSRNLAEFLVDEYELDEGEIIEVIIDEVTSGEEGYVNYEYENIWG